ncbi:MAG: caspase family protein, partial [Desulfatitalea sp.]|nr:caspase family protein [Desulfatitalea sp.]
MNKRALCIGINDYPGTDCDLSGCVNDAHDWAQVLCQRGFSVQKIFNNKATATNIRHALKSLITNAQKGDSIVIQYSGHGSFVPDLDGDEPDGTDECLCPYDVGTNGPITDDELHAIFAHAPKGVKILMISDACHSGTLTRFAPLPLPTHNSEKNDSLPRVRFLHPAVYLPKNETTHLATCRPLRRRLPTKRSNALLLSGCQDDEYSYDACFLGRPNGAFTFVALRTLPKLTPDATYADWFKEIRKALPSPQYPQTPNLHGTATM